jgi:hypothetical protein
VFRAGRCWAVVLLHIVDTLWVLKLSGLAPRPKAGSGQYEFWKVCTQPTYFRPLLFCVVVCGPWCLCVFVVRGSGVLGAAWLVADLQSPLACCCSGSHEPHRLRKTICG